MGDVRCRMCGRPLSSSGREVGLVMYLEKLGEWGIVCASAACSGIPGNVTVSELQNYFLSLEFMDQLMSRGKMKEDS